VVNVVGARRETDSVSRVLVAFLGQQSWAQADLARHVGVQPRTVVSILRGLEEAGVPFEVERDHPHVYWSVARSWFPTGLLLPTDRAATIARLLARLPTSTLRQQTLSKLLDALPKSTAIVGPDTPTVEHVDPVPPEVMSVLEDAATNHAAVRMRYYSASRGDRDDRHVSVHRIEYGRRARIVATCHRAKCLKWFRVDHVERALIDPSEPFIEQPDGTVERWISESVDGYRGPSPVERHACFVRDPDARWVKRNLPERTTADTVSGGVRLVWHAAAVEPLARFVVGLGDAATAETPSLRQAVLDLATGSLRAHQSHTSRRTGDQ
jgi:predicted DNA-binding transcriptional regulator YafY